MQDKEGGLIATLGSVEIIGHKQEAMEEDDYNDPSPLKRKGSANSTTSNTNEKKIIKWYGTGKLDTLSMSFMLDIEDKIKDRIWFGKQATSRTIAMEIPGINCLAIFKSPL